MILTAAILCLAFEPPAPAHPGPDERWMLYDRTLTARVVRAPRFEPAGLTWADPLGRRTLTRGADVLAVIRLPSPVISQPTLQIIQPELEEGAAPQPPPPSPPTPGMLYLTDGLVLPGRPSDRPAKPDQVSWDSPLVGVLTRSLDQVLRIDLADPRHVAPSKSDLLILANGDRIEGFIESVHPQVRVEVRQDGPKPAKQTLDIPLDRIATIRIASKPSAPSGMRLATRGGAVVGFTAIESLPITPSEPHRVRARGVKPDAETTIEFDELSGVVYDSASFRPLALAPIVSQAASAGRRWAEPPRVTDSSAPFGASDVLLPGPMAVEWTLPAGAVRLSTTLVLPESCRLWGDCQVTVEQVAAGRPRELLKARLNADRPEAPLTADLTEGSSVLRVRIDPGELGPIQDQVLLKAPALLIRK